MFGKEGVLGLIQSDTTFARFDIPPHNPTMETKDCFKPAEDEFLEILLV